LFIILPVSFISYQIYRYIVLKIKGVFVENNTFTCEKFKNVLIIGLIINMGKI